MLMVQVSRTTCTAMRQTPNITLEFPGRYICAAEPRQRSQEW